MCLKLAECVENGVAFHHAGLFDKQKEIIEEEFRAGNLYNDNSHPQSDVRCEPSVKNVVIRDYTRWTSQGPQPIPVFDYEQMSGSAGRPGYDTEGYSYLIAKSVDEAYNLKDHYVYGEIETTNSKLIENKDAVYRQIITQIASTLARNPQDLLEFFGETFYGLADGNNEYLNSFSCRFNGVRSKQCTGIPDTKWNNPTNTRWT